MKLKPLCFAILACSAFSAAAQEELLPQGIGLYQYGYRGYADQTQKYNAEGELESLGAPFTNEFTGRNLLEGAGGTDLRRLAQELAKYDSQDQGVNSLVEQLNLGSMYGDVSAEIDVQIFGIGYGVTDHWTLSIGVPVIEADVRTSIQFSGTNNAAAIRDQLGDLAFSEVRDGLNQAAQINGQTIQSSIESNGYAPLDHWHHKGVGDVRLGSVVGKSSRIGRRKKMHSHLRTNLNLPTGYVEDPDILTDVSTGNGYYNLENTYSHKFQFGAFWFGAEGTLGLNLPTEIEKRVPEGDEGIVSADRKATVRWTPGQDYGAAGLIGYNLSVFKTRYELGFKQHQLDQYSGSLTGNYNKLAEGSDAQSTYHIFRVELQTMDLYRKKVFPIPFMLRGAAHVPIAAKNAQDERYYELTFASFFSTPRAKLDASAEEPSKKRKKRRRNLARARH